MGRKNRPFIDKKNSTTYHFVRRSQRDVGAAEASPEELSDYVLQAVPRDDRKNPRSHDATAPDLSDVPAIDYGEVMEKKQGGMLKEIEENLRSMGLVDTTAEQYDRYTMEIGAGTFFSADTGHVASAHQKNNPLSRKIVDNLEDEIREVDRQLESIALTPRCMDDDVALALFGDFDDDDFEEINDDFCLMADKDTPEHEMNLTEEEGGGDGAFDFDAHIKRLMEQALREERGLADGYNPNVVPKGHYWKRGGEEDVFRNAKPLHMRDIDEDDEDEDSLDRELDALGDDAMPGVVPKLKPDEEKALCAKFEEALAEYDSDGYGDLDEECEEIRGDEPLEDNKKLEAIMDDFLTEKRDEIFMEGTRHLQGKSRTGGSGYSVLVGKKMMNEKETTEEIEEELVVETVDEVLAQADQILANPEVEPPAEEILIDGRSYLTERTRNPWDCESILSTYSNLDNNPAIIGKSRRRGKKKNKNDGSIPEDETIDGDQREHIQILLSDKTGLPMMQEQPEDDYYGDGNDTYMSVNKGEARRKIESAEEKKARKNAVKEERKEARMRKKMMKEAFKEEFIKRSEDVVADDVGGKSVFRYS